MKNYLNYDVYDGFIRGNMFKNLYKPYKKNEPFDIKPMNEQAELLNIWKKKRIMLMNMNQDLVRLH